MSPVGLMALKKLSEGAAVTTSKRPSALPFRLDMYGPNPGSLWESRSSGRLFHLRPQKHVGTLRWSPGQKRVPTQRWQPFAILSDYTHSPRDITRLTAGCIDTNNILVQKALGGVVARCTLITRPTIRFP